MRHAAKLIAAAGIAVGALVVLVTIHTGAVDAAADVVEVASLLMLAHTTFRIFDEPG